MALWIFAKSELSRQMGRQIRAPGERHVQSDDKKACPRKTKPPSWDHNSIRICLHPIEDVVSCELRDSVPRKIRESRQETLLTAAVDLSSRDCSL